jgi:hypothetical protein
VSTQPVALLSGRVFFASAVLHEPRAETADVRGGGACDKVPTSLPCQIRKREPCRDGRMRVARLGRGALLCLAVRRPLW